MLHYDDAPLLDEVSQTLQELFKLAPVDSMYRLNGGHLCKNFVVDISGEKVFLKQYRHKLSQNVQQIKFAEQFFADQGVSVLLPRKDKHGRTAFMIGKNWYSLFEFLPLKTKDVSQLTTKHMTLLGKQLAHMHEVGKGVGKEVSIITLWDRNRFLMEVVELERALSRRPQLTRIEKLIEEMMKRKRAFVESSNIDIYDFEAPFDVLMHGDFSYQNVFFSEDESEIAAIYDFEKAARGPRCFDLARSMFVTCFDDGWEEKNIDHAIAFLRAYYQVNPFVEQELICGIRMYLVNLAHQTWVEAKVLLKNSLDYIDLLESHAHRIEHLSDDLESFAKELFAKIQ